MAGLWERSGWIHVELLQGEWLATSGYTVERFQAVRPWVITGPIG